MGELWIWLCGFWEPKREWYRGKYLKSHHWIKFAHWRKYSKIAYMFGWNRCHDCGISGPPLDTHHLKYDHLWMEQFFPFDVVNLCRRCHERRHGR